MVDGTSVGTKTPNIELMWRKIMIRQILETLFAKSRLIDSFLLIEPSNLEMYK